MARYPGSISRWWNDMSGVLGRKVALVTGAGSGIGQAVAMRFAAEGATVIAAGRNIESVEATAAAIRSRRQGIEGVALDVTRAGDVDALVQGIVRRHGGLDIVVNAAGVLAFGTVAETDDQTWARVLGVNLTGTFHMCRAAVRAMRASGGGSIVNVSSTTGALGVGAGIAAYVASKGGIVMLTKAIAVDHARDGIRANVIAPGPTATPMLQGVMEEAQLTAFGQSLPVGRLGEPSELAATALFLASDEASFVTGALFPVDGGQTAQVGPTPKDL
jgi:3-oxoacyl-[acyl-carrier protein] reductase